MGKKYAVLLVHNYYQQAGGEDAVVEREKQMLEHHGHKVLLYTRHNDELNSFAGKINFFFSFLYSHKSYYEIKEMIIREKIDIVHMHNTFPLITTSAYRAAHDAGALVVQTLHNFRLICPGALYLRDKKVCEECNRYGFYAAIKHSCYRKSKLQTAMAVFAMLYGRKKHLYEEVDAYIALTEFNKKKFEKEFPACRGKTYVKPNFIDGEYNEQDGNVKSTDSFVFIGRLSEEKGIEVLLDAFRRLPNQKLDMIGAGPMEGQIKNYLLSNHMENVILLGQMSRNDLMQHLATSKALIVPSIWYEGFPLTMIEAFSCGIPIIGSHLGNIAVVIDDMEDGLLFNPGDAGHLMAQIERLSKDAGLYRHLKEGAKQKYLTQYTEKQNYECLLKIYDIASRKPLDTVAKS